MSDHEDHERLLQMVTGYWTAQGVYVAAELGVAGFLENGPKPVEAIAANAGADPEALYRLLRALASLGLFVEHDKGRFGLTPLARLLIKPSKRAQALVMGRIFYHAWGHLLSSVRTGEPAFDENFGMPVFDYLAQNQEEGALFDSTMTGIHGPETEPMLDAYDFSQFQTVVDIGGGNGSVISALLARYRRVEGILFDLPSVVERTQVALKERLNHRLRLESGNFFESVTAGGDAYLMRHIIHDWNDDQATAILRNCRQAMNPGGKVLVVESVVPAGNDPSFVKWLDLMMLVIGGKERSEEQYRQLFLASGLELTRIVPTAVEVSVVEGVSRD